MTAILSDRSAARSAVLLSISGALAGAADVVHAQVVRPEIVAVHPHDAEAFTQGLLLHDGRFFESTGLNGRSSLRRVVPVTGLVEHRIELASELFGEGLALVGNRLIQLTWLNNVALVYDVDFNRLGTFDYDGEGWGLCYDGSRLIMSDGSSRLFFRSPDTFDLLGEVQVARGGTPVSRLNELECVGRLVYANVWQTDTIVRVDPSSGEVLATIDASGLLTAAEGAEADVLNGIAFDPATGHFFLTGKLWPKLFEVRFNFDPLGGEAQDDGGVDDPPDAAADHGSRRAAIGLPIGRAGRAGRTGAMPSGADAGDPSSGRAGTDGGPPMSRLTESTSGCSCRLSPVQRVDGSQLGFIVLLFAVRRMGVRRRRRQALQAEAIRSRTSTRSASPSQHREH